MNIPIRSSEITGETREERVDSLIALVAKKEKERERQQLDTAGLICPICGERSDTNSYILIDGVYKHLCAKCEAILNSRGPRRSKWTYEPHPPNRS